MVRLLPLINDAGHIRCGSTSKEYPVEAVALHKIHAEGK